MNLQIRNSHSVATSVPPFHCALRAGRIELSAPAFATIASRGRLGWRAIHSGQSLASAGILNEQSQIALSFPLTSRLRVSLAGQDWLVEMPRPATSGTRTQWIGKRVLAFAAFSVLLHFTLVGIFGWHELAPGTTTATETAKPKTASAAPAALSAGTPIAQPFGGMSYTHFIDRWIERTGSAADRLNHLLKKAGSFGNVAFGGKVAANAGNGTGRVDVVGVAGGTGLGEAVEQHYQAPSAKVAKAVVTSAGSEAELRESLRGLKERWQRAYSEALVADSKLSLTVAYSLQVGADGALQLTGFTPHGNYQPAALKILQAGMTAAVREVRVDRKFAGALLRGENVFIH